MGLTRITVPTQSDDSTGWKAPSLHKDPGSHLPGKVSSHNRSEHSRHAHTHWTENGGRTWPYKQFLHQIDPPSASRSCPRTLCLQGVDASNCNYLVQFLTVDCRSKPLRADGSSNSLHHEWCKPVSDTSGVGPDFRVDRACGRTPPHAHPLETARISAR